MRSDPEVMSNSAVSGDAVSLHGDNPFIEMVTSKTGSEPAGNVLGFGVVVMVTSLASHGRATSTVEPGLIDVVTWGETVASAALSSAPLGPPRGDVARNQMTTPNRTMPVRMTMRRRQ